MVYLSRPLLQRRRSEIGDHGVGVEARADLETGEEGSWLPPPSSPAGFQADAACHRTICDALGDGLRLQLAEADEDLRVTR